MHKFSDELTHGRLFLFSFAGALGQHDVGHSGVFTGCEALTLSSSISADVWTPAEN